VADLADYLDLTVGQAREQFRVLLMRRPVQDGRQVAFLPVETLLCLAASFVVNHRHFGGSTAYRAPEPVPSLGRLFARPSSSVLAKMANLDGSRSHGGRWDVLAGAMLREDPARFSAIYRILLHAARAEGIGPARLPDFLSLEQGGELALLGQEELNVSVLEAALRDQVTQQSGASVWSDLETERILLAAARVGRMCSPGRCWLTAEAGASSADCGPRRSALPGCCWLGTSNRGKTAHRPSASTLATAWRPAPPTTWRSTLECSRSTEDCASISPGSSPTLSRQIRSPGSITGSRRYVR